jgi:hypothetical protein
MEGPSLGRLCGYLDDGGEGEGIAAGALCDAAFCANSVAGSHGRAD